MDYTIVVASSASDPSPLQFLAPLRRLRHRRVLPRQRPPRPDHLRRPVQARRGLPRDLAPPAPAAGPRGLPGRRLLPPLPAPRAGGQAQRRARRRLAHRPAHHRDPGGRRLGLHPDQRHLHHRRPDLPPARALQRRRPAGHQRRHLGLPRRRQRPDQGHEAGRRQAQARPGPVPRARHLRPVRDRARQDEPGPARPRRAADRDPQAGPVRRRSPSRSRSSSSTPATAATSTSSRSPRSGNYEKKLYEHFEKDHADILTKIREKKHIDTALDGEISAALKAFNAVFQRRA